MVHKKRGTLEKQKYTQTWAKDNSTQLPQGEKNLMYEIGKARLYQTTKYTSLFTFYMLGLFKFWKPNASCSQVHSI